MELPFFTIIIPVFNSEKTIDMAIGSILNQVYRSFEVLIIDGLSTDETVKKVQAYNDSRIKVHSEKDKGIYDAMNKGIALAKGTWLMFLGSDDQLFDNLVLNDIHAAIHSNDKVIYGNVYINGNTGWGSDGQIYDGEFTIEKLLKVNIAHQAIFYHKEVFEKCGHYDLQYKICGDFDFNLRVASKFKMRYIERTIAKFYAGGASTDVRDLDFEANYSKNIIQYFNKQLYHNSFKGLERYILRQGVADLKQFKALSGSYLLLVGAYFRIKRYLL